MSEKQYRSVLVIGAHKVGKTSILAASLNGDFSETYSPTGFRAESFYDVERGIQLIDTPGIDAESLLTADKYQKFKEDPIVFELLGKQPKERRELLTNVDFNSLYGYVIVYSPNLRHSIKMARALHYVIRTERRDVPILLVENTGDIPPGPEDIDANENWELREGRFTMPTDPNEDMEAYKLNMIFTDIDPKKLTPPKSIHVVCAQTFSGLDKLMDELSSREHKDALRQQFKRATGGRTCDPRRCAIL